MSGGMEVERRDVEAERKERTSVQRNKLRQIGRWVDSSSNSYLEKVRPSWLFENVCHCDRA